MEPSEVVPMLATERPDTIHGTLARPTRPEKNIDVMRAYESSLHTAFSEIM